MSGGIFLLHGEDDVVRMTEQPYDTEDVLQALLARFPDLLAGDQFGSSAARRWLLIGRETAVASQEDRGGRWTVDHLFVDQDAVPTLVEVKRSSDTRIRREVVGQLLEYAANGAHHWPVAQLRALYEAACATRGADPNVELRAVLGEDADIESWWD